MYTTICLLPVVPAPQTLSSRGESPGQSKTPLHMPARDTQLVSDGAREGSHFKKPESHAARERMKRFYWSLSTRDKWGWPYTVEPLYKGQAKDVSFVTHHDTVEPGCCHVHS